MADLIIGIQWGDEGKGKVVDLLAKNYDFVVRFGGGHNAGHTIVTNGRKVALHLLPSGILYEHCKNVIGNGVVVDLNALVAEIKSVFGANGADGADSEIFENLKDRLFISDRAHIIFSYHAQRDLDSEKVRAKSGASIGTTGKGIGPAYTDKVARVGVRMGDLKDLQNLKNKLSVVLDSVNVDSVIAQISESREKLLPFICDTTKLLTDAKKAGAKILLEGAQGSMLDIEHGTYPFVTSSNTLSSGASAGSGLNIKDINKITGIAKAYCTRVGNGAFPSEDFGADSEHLQKVGAEFGTTTGRARRCGWFDCVAVKYACELSGVDSLAIMKLDVLSGLKKVKVCTAYELNGAQIDYVPFDLDSVKGVFTEFDGWSENIAGVRKFTDLPKSAQNLLNFIQEQVGVKISLISTSPEREDVIMR